MTTIKLVGIEELDSIRRLSILHAMDSLRFYGYRESDVAQRMVAIELPMKEAAEVMREAEVLGDFPVVEIEDKYWTYVSHMGAGQARIRKDDNAT